MFLSRIISRRPHFYQLSNFYRWYWIYSNLHNFCHTWEGLCRHSTICVDSDDLWNVSHCRSISGSGHSKCCGNGDIFSVSFHNTFRELDKPVLWPNIMSSNEFCPCRALSIPVCPITVSLASHSWPRRVSFYYPRQGARIWPIPLRREKISGMVSHSSTYFL